MMRLVFILLLFLPTLFQYVFGNRSINNKTNLAFQSIVLISIVSHIVMTFLSMYLFLHSLPEHSCATPIVGIIPISGILFFVLLVILVVQSNRKG